MALTEWQLVTAKHMRDQSLYCAKTWRAFATPGHWGNGIRTPEECERLAQRCEAEAEAITLQLRGLE